MYSLNLKNQAVKECVNGASVKETAAKYKVHHCTIQNWVKEYRTQIEAMNITTGSIPNNPDSSMIEEIKKEPRNVDHNMKLKSININIDGKDVVIYKHDINKLVEIFSQFDE